MALGRKRPYFVKEHSYSKSKYIEDDIINMLELLMDSIFVVFGGKDSQIHVVGIPMAANCVPFLADIFLYSYEAKFIHSCEIDAVFSLGLTATVSISVQLHI